MDRIDARIVVGGSGRTDMQSKARTVDEYLEEVPPERLPALQELRRLCRKHLRGFQEAMVYGMPGYSRAGVVEVGFASQKNNVALYILRKDVMDAYRGEFPASAVGKGCIRYANPHKIDFAVVENLLKGTYESKGRVC
jgi:uncharacterized protein YdhG (YjbR/CyaY superfamily)